MSASRKVGFFVGVATVVVAGRVATNPGGNGVLLGGLEEMGTPNLVGGSLNLNGKLLLLWLATNRKMWFALIAEFGNQYS